MKKTTGRILLIVLAILLLASFAACGSQKDTQGGKALEINTVEIIPSAYLNEVFDLRDVILMEDGVSYSAKASYVKYTLDEASRKYTSSEYMLNVEDLCFTPTEVVKNIVTITAERDGETASKVVVIPTTIRADALDELLHSGGIYALADPGISKSINLDSAFIKGEDSRTSLQVNFSGVDPHQWGNTFIALDSAEVQKHFTDQTWKNSLLTFWVYNPNEKAVEFQLRIGDPISGVDVDWSPMDGPNKQIAQPGQWTQVFFPLRKLGLTKPVTSSQFVSCAMNVKVRYEAYSTTDSYTYSFYVDGLDVVDASLYPEIDNTYVLSDETLEQGWENMAQDTGWQGVYTEYNYENIQGENSTCSLKAYFNNDKAMTNSFICLATEMDSRITELPDMTGGKFSAYFKFENMPTRVSLDIVNKSWTTSNQVDFALKSVGDGWYYGEVDLEDLQVGTGRNDQIIRIRLNFYGVSKDSIVYVDTCKFEYKYVHKVLESVSADWINMTADNGSAYYYTVKSDFVTSHLKGSNTVRSLKLVAPAGDHGRYALNTDQANINGEISAVPNMNKGTLGAWFYFGDQIPEAYAFITNDQWHSSNWIDFIFTENAGDGWYYGKINASGFTCSEGGGTSKAIRLTLVIPAGYTVYVDNLSWKAGTEEELVSADVPKPGSGKYGFEQGKDLNVGIKTGKPIKQLTFDYKIESGDNFNMALMPDWENYFGYFAFNAEGSVDPYNGITCQKLEDGAIRVTMDMTAISKYSGRPSKIIDFFYIRGDWTDASGYIANIQYIIDTSPEAEKPVGPEEGEYMIVAGEDRNIDLEAVDTLERVSFDYKLTSGEVFNIALMPNWESYYGYYALNASGEVDPYPGVYCKALEDGYVRVIFEISELNKTVGTPSGIVDFIYIRGNWTDANGTIQNVVLNGDEKGTDIAQPDVPVEPEVPAGRGQEIKPSTDLTIELNNTEKLGTLSFDYKVISGTFNISLNPDWDNAFGYFAFDANGNVDPYDGVTVEDLDDGYKRVTFDLNALTKYSGNPSKVLTFLYIRGAWTDAAGYIDNVQYTVAEDSDEPEVPAERGQEIKPSTDLTIELNNTEKLGTLSFDYKVTSGTFNISLNPGWDNAFGYFAFDANGNVDSYDGVTVEDLDDGYKRVTFDLNALTKYSGNPSKVLTFLYIRGGWTDATGYIDNVQFTVAEEPVEPEVPANRGQEIKPSTDLTIELSNTEKLGTLSFDYKVISGTFNISLNPDWDNGFGYFAFDANGNVDPYEGVTVEELDDGYKRVTFDLNALTKYSGNPSKVLTFLYIRGGWTDATGYIDNVQFAEAEDTEEPEVPEISSYEISAGTDLTIELNNAENLGTISFDYKVSKGTFNISLNPDWDSYYGYFAFDAGGDVDPYDGVTVENLENGYKRVTFDLKALTKTNGTPSKVLSFLYVRGAWTDAAGYIENVQYTAAEDSSDTEAPDEIVGGATLVSRTDCTFDFTSNKALSQITFDYKVTGTFNIALMSDWENYYGYFAFDAGGDVDPYDGITCQKLDNGYIRVTIDMKVLNKTGGTPTTVIDFMYVRGAWSDATGEITNICLYWDETETQSSRTLSMRFANFLVSTFKRIEDMLVEDKTAD